MHLCASGGHRSPECAVMDLFAVQADYRCVLDCAVAFNADGTFELLSNDICPCQYKLMAQTVPRAVGIVNPPMLFPWFLRGGQWRFRSISDLLAMAEICQCDSRAKKGCVYDVRTKAWYAQKQDEDLVEELKREIGEPLN